MTMGPPAASAWHQERFVTRARPGVGRGSATRGGSRHPGCIREVAIGAMKRDHGKAGPPWSRSRSMPAGRGGGPFGERPATGR